MSDDIKTAGGAPPRPATAPDLDALRVEAKRVVHAIEKLVEHPPFADICSNAVERIVFEALRARPVPEGADRT